MPSVRALQPLINQPREDLGAEYKDWLDITKNHHKALLAKAAIAIANHGGGFIVIGFAENAGRLISHSPDPRTPEVTQDSVNNTVARYCSPSFHCQLYYIEHPSTKVCHPVIAVPGDHMVPVMSKRSQEGVIAANRCYVRKQGPCSEEPKNADEWRGLFDRCIKAGRSEMLDAIRTILHGHIETENALTEAINDLKTFCEIAHKRWFSLIADEPLNSPARLPQGYYEIGFSLVGVPPLKSLNELRTRLREAGRIALTGWPPFLERGVTGWEANVFEDYVEAWMGRPINNTITSQSSPYCDFWRASPEGMLYTIRGYMEDDLIARYTYHSGESVGPGEVIDLTYPVRCVSEGLLFAKRFAETFDEVDEIVVYTRFTGLKNRCLISLTKSRGYHEYRTSDTDEVTLETRATLEQTRNNIVEIIHELLAPLYEKFGFFELSTRLVSEEIQDLRKQREACALFGSSF